TAVYARVGDSVPTVKMTQEITFPLARGLGASAAAIVGGLVAANALLGNPMTPEELLQTASSIEGHPDNVAPALLGGCQLVIKDGERIVAAEVPLPDGLKAVLFIPDFELKTEEARRILSGEIPRADAVFNVGRAALLTTALAAGRLEYLRLATQDRLHQPARRSLFPQMYDFFEAAMDAGALGAFLSGSGPTIMALAKDNERAIADSMEKVARKAKIAGATLVTKPTKLGAQVIPLE
ncbi:MAG: homoserine kinase, partial [Chloroflexi bacterium]|nr:homoserine kinase [Chloroflexota bacterium]